MQHRNQKCKMGVKSATWDSKVQKAINAGSPKCNMINNKGYSKQNWRATKRALEGEATWHNNILSRESKVQHVYGSQKCHKSAKSDKCSKSKCDMINNKGYRKQNCRATKITLKCKQLDIITF